ncbi:hypothetical protein MASR2M15_07600 [Anaerolineales bacterium]
MHIDRRHSRKLFRKRQRRGGCLTFFVLLALITSIGLLTWQRVGDFLHWNSNPAVNADLSQLTSAFQSGQLDKVIKLASQIRESNPHNIPALVMLIRSLIYRSYSDYDHAHDRQQAKDIVLAALADFPDHPDILAIYALVLNNESSYKEANKIALDVIDSYPLHVVARIALAQAYGAQGGFDASLREANKAIELAQTYAPEWLVDAYRIKAIAYSDLGQYADAIAVIDLALQQNHYLLPLYFERALYALQIGNTDLASISYFQVLAFDDGNVKSRLRLCELTSTLRERETAIQYCSDVTGLAPQWADAWYFLGREYFLQGNFTAAQDVLHKCSSLQIMQNIPIPERRFECWYLQGQAAEIRGDCPALLATYNEYLEMATHPEIEKTWVYPPEGPSICVDPAPH